jgi:FkbM family methyltransferase
MMRCSPLCGRAIETFKTEGVHGLWRRGWGKLRHNMRQLTFRPYVIERRVAGERIQFLVGDLFGEDWYGPHHDPMPELDWIRAHGICAGDVVIDCGANHGFCTVLFARWAGPQGNVYAFEPLAHNMEILRENLRLNSIDTVVERAFAVGENSGTVRITPHPNASVIVKGQIDQSLEVPIVRLDDEFAGHTVNFLKIDVEGFELEVLKGATKVLSSAPRLALEVHVCMYENKVQQLRKLLALVPVDKYTQVEIQYEVDGLIRRFDPTKDSPERLATCEVAHIFCR